MLSWKATKVTSTTELNGILRFRVVRVLPDGGAEVRIGVESCTTRNSGVTSKVDVKTMDPMSVEVSADGRIKDFVAALETRKGNILIRDSVFEITEANVLGISMSVLETPCPSHALSLGESWKQKYESSHGGGMVIQTQLVDISVSPGHHRIASLISAYDRVASEEEFGAEAVKDYNGYQGRASYDLDSGWLVSIDQSLSGGGNTRCRILGPGFVRSDMDEHIKLISSSIAK